ncbi:geranylgeranyl reductase family protein [Frankia sp. CiP1_Cm_nod1]|uniref:geranylgeranyl reductase family protein n=1 Tax=Frankia sp. CiP1_Cm_nod1 TaxID=2897160 RepID=UPI002023E4FC
MSASATVSPASPAASPAAHGPATEAGPAGTIDLLVVGAGPAGCAAALRALQLRPHTRVVLLDAADFPRDKACGDGIAPHGLDVLRALGVPDAAAGFTPVDRMRLRAPGGAQVATPCPRANYVVPRKIFDARLVAAARARGAVLRRERVRSVVAGGAAGDPVLVNGHLRARVVIGADGANSATRRALGIGPNPPEALAIAVRGYADAPSADRPPEQLIEMTDQGWPAYAWSFPIGDGRANIGYGMLRSKLDEMHGDGGGGDGGGDGGGSGRAVLYGTLARMLADQPAYPGTLRAHHLPLSTWRPRQPDGPVLLAGDAASLINPLTGEGIYYALLSGSLAGQAAVTAAPGAAGAAYRHALDRELGRHLRHTTLLAELAGRHRTLMDAAVAAASHRTELFDTLLEIGLGRGTIPTASLARLAVRKLVAGWQ